MTLGQCLRASDQRIAACLDPNDPFL
jgi:hypothetical protein